MENQHRELNTAEIEILNEIKKKGEELEQLINKITSLSTVDRDQMVYDGRWLNIGRTHLQQGLMALTRAVAKPDFF